MNLLTKFISTRERTENICKPLELEDYVVQPIVDVSPPKWHLAHTTWFFEEFVLSKFVQNYKCFNNQYSFLFNSYYETVGEKVMRTNRGNLSRPSVQEIYKYREYVTKKIEKLLQKKTDKEISELVEIGIHHEQQHQELLITDIKYILGNNPLFPKYDDFQEQFKVEKKRNWITFDEGVYKIGYNRKGFSFDNEHDQHKKYIHSFQIADTLITNGEYIEFIQDKGYQNVKLWHAEGWDWINKNKIIAPQYWHKIENKWYNYTLNGLEKVDLKNVLTHVSYYEAFAFAQWKGCRLPTEFEWEIAADKLDWGARWEWTESAHLPYPNYKIPKGAIGEYNGKFMVNQKVLRGASVATAEDHSRKTYRNFFHPNLRWQYTGIRLAKNN